MPTNNLQLAKAAAKARVADRRIAPLTCLEYAKALIALDEPPVSNSAHFIKDEFDRHLNGGAISPEDAKALRAYTEVLDAIIESRKKMGPQAKVVSAAKAPKELPPVEDPFWNRFDVPHTADCLDECPGTHWMALPRWDGRTNLADRLKSGPYDPSDYEPARVRIAKLIIDAGIDPLGAATLENYRAIESRLWTERDKLPAGDGFKALTNSIGDLWVAWMAFRKPPPKFERPAATKPKQFDKGE